jgi:8-oxo-dGTP pyrophosphatase MutT (NUDIX family)
MYKTRAPKYNWKATKSYGIILTRLGNDDILEFLMVCRRNTFSYVDFVLGKYKENDVEYLSHLIINMTQIERNNLRCMKYVDIWNNLYAFSRKPEGDFFYQVEKKFYRSHSIFMAIDIKKSCYWLHPEYGFPKGKKNEIENSLQSAMRELEEETGITKNMYMIDSSINPFEEEFIGTNGLKYINVFYVANANQNCQEFLNKNDLLQMREISNIQWFSYRTAMKNIRFHEKSKVVLIQELLKIKYKT